MLHFLCVHLRVYWVWEHIYCMCIWVSDGGEFGWEYIFVRACVCFGRWDK